MGADRLRVIAGQAVQAVDVVGPEQFQAECVESFVASWTARGFSETTIANDAGVLERMLDALDRPAWEVTATDVDRVVGALAASGRAVSTRRNYVQVFKGFHRFLEVRKAAEIEAAFGVRLGCPLDEFNGARHVGDDTPAADPPPMPERVAAFFEFLKGRVATARKYGPAARDYALFRTLYHAGLRARGNSDAGSGGRAVWAGPVREAARPFWQGRQDIRASPTLGAHAGWLGSRAAMVPRRCPRPVSGLGCVVV